MSFARGLSPFWAKSENNNKEWVCGISLLQRREGVPEYERNLGSLGNKAGC